MSLDISVTNKKGISKEMNWLRNPYGLEMWAHHNSGIYRKKDLYYVINNWNYKKSSRVNKKLFYKTVHEYWDKINKLKRGYFFFDISSYIQFVQPKYDEFPHSVLLFPGEIERIKDAEIEIREGCEYIAIPMEYFKDNSAFNLGFREDETPLEHYKEWFKELVEFADILIIPGSRFYCSN